MLFVAGLLLALVWWQLRGTNKGESLKIASMTSGQKLQSLPVAPGFEGGGEWLNSEPVVLAEVFNDGKTKAVLVDFWTYSCINCQRTIPYLRSWWEKYKDKGLLIVGVHSPEFEFERDKTNLEAAIEKYGVGWPVVQDNEMKIWRAYANNFWPRKYLVNSEGKIVYDHIGEGAYEETEKAIQELLDAEMEVTKEPEVGGYGFGMKQTPELYVNLRGQTSGHLGKGMDKVELGGDWDLTEDYAEAGEGASLKLDFMAGEVNLVMSAVEESGEKQVRYLIDDGEEQTILVIDNDLYSLWKGKFGKRRLLMSFEPGVRVHAFTFGR